VNPERELANAHNRKIWPLLGDYPDKVARIRSYGPWTPDDRFCSKCACAAICMVMPAPRMREGHRRLIRKLYAKIGRERIRLELLSPGKIAPSGTMGMILYRWHP
jgi:hypothetical protein